MLHVSGKGSLEYFPGAQVFLVMSQLLRMVTGLSWKEMEWSQGSGSSVWLVLKQRLPWNREGESEQQLSLAGLSSLTCCL